MSETRLNALIVQSGFIGDVVLATPLIEALAAAGYRPWVLTTPAAAPLLTHHPDIAGIIIDDKRGQRRGLSGLLATAWELRAKKFELALSPHRAHRTALMLLLSGIGRRVGFRSAPLSWTFTEQVEVDPSAHQIDKNLALLHPLGIRSTAALKLRMAPEVISEASELLRALPRPIIAVAPGSVWPTKQWPAEKFVQTLNELGAQRQFGLLLVGDKRDQTAAGEIAARLRRPLLDLSGKTSLPLLCELIARADLLIANDSAPVHIGGAYRVPTVAVFLATHPKFGFGPKAQPFRIVQTDLPCRPCAPHGSMRCPLGHFDCARTLDALDVANAALDLLKSAPMRG